MHSLRSMPRELQAVCVQGFHGLIVESNTSLEVVFFV